MSFQDAAAELHVTPAALSYQIKSLEEQFGAPLFHRMNRKVELTEAGAALAPGAAEGFANLRAAWRAAKRTRESGVLTVTAGPAFTARWLAPRLFDFASKHPEVELRFAATLRLLDFRTDDIDIAIRFGQPRPGEEEALHVALDLGEWMTPMMTPDLAARHPTPDSLRDAPLIHQDDTAAFTGFDWGTWFRAASVPLPEPHGPRFSQADHALDAAQAGAGVVLGRMSLADAALRTGALVAPFDVAIVPEARYRVLCPKGAQERPATRAFLDWLRGEIATMADHSGGRVMVDAADVAATPEA